MKRSCRPGSHLGLDSMRQRAHELGGDLQVEFSSGGTRVHAVLPLVRSVDHD
jgi:signal transduction histidine kinase